MAFRPLRHPFTLVISAPSGGGKTEWVAQLCRNMKRMIVPFPARIVWHYGIYQETYRKLQNELHINGININFVQGYVDNVASSHIEDAANSSNLASVSNTLYIYDDVMFDVGKDVGFAKLFTQGRHHQKISIIFMLNNLYFQDRMMKTIQINTQYLVLLKSPRDKSQIGVIGRQLMGTPDWKYFVNAYEQATSHKLFGYLFVDLKPETPDVLQLSTNIFDKATFFAKPSLAGMQPLEILYNEGSVPKHVTL